MPQAGAILAIRGLRPAKRADGPSVRMILKRSASVPEARPAAPDMSRACLRVLATSKGDVRRAAEVPEIAPQMKAIQAPSYPRRAKLFFQAS